MNPQTSTPPRPGVVDDQDQDNKASFAETALKLGGKSADEAGRMGALDKDLIAQLRRKRPISTETGPPNLSE